MCVRFAGAASPDALQGSASILPPPPANKATGEEWGRSQRSLGASRGARTRAKEEATVSGSSFVGLLFEKKT
jgi:hypothetical protein